MAFADLDPVPSTSLRSDAEHGLRERLELFQVFTQIYSHHRDWLRRLVNFDKDAIAALNPASMHYIQGIVSPGGSYLVSNLANGRSQTFMASESGWTLGRDPRQSDLSVLDRQLSRCHARLKYVIGSGFILSDEGSTNGTFINGKAVDSPQCLRDGDQISLGSLTLCFFTCDVADEPSSSSAAKVIHADKSAVLEPVSTATLPGY